MATASDEKNRSLDAALHGLALAAVVWCVADLFSRDRVPLYRDLLFFVYPYRAFLADHLAGGDMPFWNPFVQLGVPFAASLHAGVFYPPSLILLVPLPLGFNLFLVAHFAIGWLGSLMWLRDRRASSSGAVAGALVFSIGGYLVASVTNTAHLQAAVWVPWVLFAWGRSCTGRGGFIATALLLVVELLAGAPEVWISTLALVAAWTAVIGSPEGRTRARLVARFGACVGIALALAAFQLVPTAEYLHASRRISQLPYAELTYWSMSPVSLLQLLFPHSTSLLSEAERGTIGAVLEARLPLVHSIYLGIAALCLVPAGATGRPGAFWMVVSAVGVFVALGPASPLYTTLLAAAPDLLGRIRYPEKFLFLFHIGAVALVARGATAVFAGERAALRVSATAAAALGVLPLVLAAIAWRAPERLVAIAAVLSGRGDWPLDAFVDGAIDLAYKAERALWLLAGWGILVGMRLRHRLGHALFGILALLLLAGDLAATNRGLWLSLPLAELENSSPRIDVDGLRRSGGRVFHYRTTGDDTGLLAWTPAIDERTDLRRFAVEGWRTLFFASGMLHGVGNLSAADSIGGQPLLDQSLARLPHERAIDLLGALGVSILVGPGPLSAANVEPVHAGDGEPFVYRIAGSRPFAFLVPEIETAVRPEAALERLAASGFPRRRRAIVERLPDGWPATTSLPQPEERAVLRLVASDEIEVEVSCRATRFLVISSAFSPGWRAELDGRPVEIIRTNALVQGVVVPEGHHRARFVYRPPGLSLGLTVSVLTLGLLIATWSTMGRRRLRDRCGP